MKGKLVVICGGMASGKTTLAKELEKDGIRRCVTYTTRPKRDGEEDAVDYVFLTVDEFAGLINMDFFAETQVKNTVHGVWYYGTAKIDILPEEHDRVIVLDAAGITELYSKHILTKENSLLVYLDLPESLRLRRLDVRGDNMREILRRIDADNRDERKMLATVKPDIVFRTEFPAELMAYMISNALNGARIKEEE